MNPAMSRAEPTLPTVRTGADQYRATVATYRRNNISDEERQALIDRARQGDHEARQAITMVMFGMVAHFAHRIAANYDWASPRLEYEELAQIGMLAVIERLDAALLVTSVYGYLAKAAWQEITNYCYQYAGLIRRPRPEGGRKTSDRPVLPVASLDAAHGDGVTLADTLAAPASQESAPTRDYSPLYAAVEQLTEKQQEVIRRHYGLGCAPESLYAIEGPGGTRARSLHRRATLALAKQLRGADHAI